MLRIFFLDLDSRYLKRPLATHKTIFLTGDPVKLDFYTIRVLAITDEFRDELDSSCLISKEKSTKLLI